MRICRASMVRLIVALSLGLLLSAARAGAVVTINVGSAAGTQGSKVTFQVTLSAMGEQVGGTINTIVFDPSTPITACTTNPAFILSVCNLQPQGCTPSVDCQQVRCFVAPFTGEPIPDGSVLYACDVQIASNAAPGVLSLACSDPSASGPSGSLITECSNGQVQVLPAPTPTATATPGPGGGGGGGCQIGPMHESYMGSTFWLLAVILLWAYGRREPGTSGR